MPLKDQLAEFRAGWFKRVPSDRQACQVDVLAWRLSASRVCSGVAQELPPYVTPHQVGYRLFQQMGLVVRCEP